MTTTHAALIAEAAATIRPHHIQGRISGDVGSVLVTTSGNHYRGVCIDTACGTGFCAEHAAIAAMVTAGEYQIKTIVAVWRKAETGELFVLPPCGRCREFIRQIDEYNIDTQVVLGAALARPLRELLPHWEWPQALEGQW